MQSVLDYYAQFMALSKDSPVIGGMVGLWIAGMITWALRSLPKQLWHTLVSQLTVTLTMTNAGTNGNALHFVAFQKWAGQRQGGTLSKRFAVSTQQYQVDGPPDVSMGFGLHAFIFKGRLFWYRKVKLDSSGSDMEKYEITVHGLTRNRQLIHDLVEAFYYREDRKGTGIVEFDRYNWGDRFIVPQRDLNTVVLNHALKEKITGTISEFIASEAWYRQRSLAYKLTCILEGPPGTGKTSLVRAIASWLGRDIFTVNISQLNDGNIMKLVRGVKKGSIILVEDFDTNGTVQRRAAVVAGNHDFTIKLVDGWRPIAVHPEFGEYGLNRGSENAVHLIEYAHNHSDKLMDSELSDAMVGAMLDAENGGSKKEPTPSSALSLSALLNALDGVLPLDDVIVFMTTNAIGDIDPALLRKGRVDHIFHVPLLEDAEVVQYVETMCPGYALPIDRRFKTIAGCDLQALYLENKHDEEAFVNSIPSAQVPASELPKVMYINTACV